MLKITAIGNLTHDVELKMNENTGKPYAILRIASDRRYKDKDGNKPVSYTHLDVYKRQSLYCSMISASPSPYTSKKRTASVVNSARVMASSGAKMVLFLP